MYLIKTLFAIFYCYHKVIFNKDTLKGKKMYFVTGASGQLGHLVIEALLKKVPANKIIAGVRNVEKSKESLPKGINVRHADYDDKASLLESFKGVDRLLLISSSEVGKRFPQHKNVIDAAKEAGVKFVAYTSLLHADKKLLGLSEEHLETEDYLKSSGLSYSLLRHGWYTENYAASIAPALTNGGFYGSAGTGKISSAARADYAEVDAEVLVGDNHEGKTYEVAGDDYYTLADFAKAISDKSGKNIPYINLPEGDYAAALEKAGLPKVVAEMLADSDAGAAKGGLFDDSKTLSQLIGHPTTPYKDVIAKFVK